MKRFILLLLGICMCFFFSTGCTKSTNEEVNVAAVVDEPSKVEMPKELLEEVYEEKVLEGMELSRITGEYIKEESVNRVPFAITINNLHKALPQSGIGQASLYYETLAEGEITRIIAIFEDFDAKKIGPIRSARDYFTYFALDNGAVYVHHGGSDGGYAAIRNRGLANIDGMVDSSFWRDQIRVNAPGMYEHSSYSSAEELIQSAMGKKFDMTVKTVPMFSFYDTETALGGEALTAKTVTLPYSSYQVSDFTYDEKDRLYYRSQSGKPQIDELTGETVTVKNIIIQETEVSVIPGDDQGRRNVKLVGSGNGVLITNGKARVITWEKIDYKTPTKWYDEKGNELKINPGKTWICIFPTYLDYTLE